MGFGRMGSFAGVKMVLSRLNGAVFPDPSAFNVFPFFGGVAGKEMTGGGDLYRVLPKKL